MVAPCELSRVGALSAALITRGEEDTTHLLLGNFHWGHTFLSLNSRLSNDLSMCTVVPTKSTEDGEDEGVDDHVCEVWTPLVFRSKPTFDKQFVCFTKRYIMNLTARLDSEKVEEFKKGIENATKFLLGKL